MLTRTLPVLSLGVALLLAGPGCGDEVTCPSQLVVVIATPSNGSSLSADVDPNTDGIQVDVDVRSNLLQDDTFTLSVTDASNQTTTFTATADSSGSATFSGVTVPPGAVTLNVVGESDKGCGMASDQVGVEVVGSSDCVLTIREGLLDVPYYAPTKVLNTTNDTNANVPNFQANIDVSTIADVDVEVFVLDVDSASENSAGVMSADSAGNASFPLTLAQGNQAIRATCRSSTSTFSATSATTFVFVDTEAPTCTLTPAPDTTIIPSMDTDGNDSNGAQVVFTGTANPGASADVEGEPAEVIFDSVSQTTPALDASGQSAVTLTFDTVKSYAVAFTAQDHAGNSCMATGSYPYQTDGCAITLVSPTGVITSDSNGDGTDGLTADLVVTVDAACEGKTVTTDCAIDGAQTGTVPAGGGDVTIPIKVCDNVSCTVPARTCSAEVTNDQNITTSAGVTIEADTEAPTVSLIAVNPNPLPCGQTVTTAADTDGNAANGVQIVVQLSAVPPPPSGNSWIRLTNDANPGGLDTQVNPFVSHTLTLEAGDNTIQAIADDQHGNRGTSAACLIALSEVAITVDPPADDGFIAGSENGVSVTGSDATFDFCGTVSEAGADVTLDLDNGNQIFNTTATGTTWCVNNVTLSEGNHTYSITATAGALTGFLTNRPLVVDVTPPGDPTVTGWTAITRHQGRVTWTSAGGDGFIVRWADSAFTDATFDSVPNSSTESSSAVAKTIDNLRAGTSYWVGVAATDASGNRSTAQIMGPITPDFDASGGVDPTATQNDDDKHFGWAMARGYFNSDSYSDVAISAPYETTVGGDFGGVVYIYLGGPNGLDTTPTYRITSPTGFTTMGYGLTAIQWDADPLNRDDLAIGAPFQNKVWILPGGSGFDPPMGAALPIEISVDQAAAVGGATISIDPSASYLAGSNIGWSLARARVDSDGRDDLIIGAPSAGGNRGGVVVLYGGVAGNVALSDTSAANMNGARAHLFKNPETITGALFGNRVTNLGPTRGTSDDVAISRAQSLQGADNDRVYILRGRTKPAAGSPVTETAFNAASDLSVAPPMTADTDTYFGDSMGTVPSVNGDGVREIVIGAFRLNTGAVYIVNGNAVGDRSADTPTADPTNGIRLLQITAEPGQLHWGAMVLNNAEAQDADVDADGIEDLIIAGGTAASTGVKLYVWFGDALPTANTTAASAHHTISAPSGFQGVVFSGRISPIVAAWAGDTNGDGLEDICWADHNASTDGGMTFDGVAEFLDDDGM